MTEAEWLTFTDLEVPLRGGLDQLVEHARRPLSQRKLRLFLLACVRRVCHVFRDRRSLFAVDTAEQFADGLMTWEESIAADEQVNNPPNPDCLEPNTWPPQQSPGYCAIEALAHAGNCTIDCFTALQGAGWAQGALGEDAEAAETVAQAAILRDIFGNPFRPAAISPAWQTPAVVALAQAAYDNRILPAGALASARLAVLADALEEAGCADAELLGHLRGPGPHVRGCWALDLVLGKS
jgi:hypothetical protein